MSPKLFLPHLSRFPNHTCSFFLVSSPFFPLNNTGGGPATLVLMELRYSSTCRVHACRRSSITHQSPIRHCSISHVAQQLVLLCAELAGGRGGSELLWFLDTDPNDITAQTMPCRSVLLVVGTFACSLSREHGQKNHRGSCRWPRTRTPPAPPAEAHLQ